MSAALLPDPQAWHAAAREQAELFDALERGARIGLIARHAPDEMLVWETSATGVAVDVALFSGFAHAGVDLLLSADEASLAAIRGATGEDLFAVMRAEIRRGALVCYVLRRRCELDALGYEELLDALGFAFLGACR
jgi:hypothetical protein